MGNASSKDHRTPLGTDPSDTTQSIGSGPSPVQPSDRHNQPHPLRGVPGRGSRHDLSFLSLGRNDPTISQPDKPRETRQEREARRAERERQARLRERERSLKEEGVDGGYLVTLGTYTGPEDFSKSTVRQLQIERRLAPFWKGLNDHDDSWTEAQLVAAVRGLPIPAADEIPSDSLLSHTASHPSGAAKTAHLAIPIPGLNGRPDSPNTQLSTSHPTSTTLLPHNSPSAALLRGRAKTLASMATGAKSFSPDMTPQEIRLPYDPYVNGVPVEAYLYKEAVECPICFMYYPQYLNKTRCCDQLICSECFVQIKRPDPHPPEHEQPGQERRPEEEAGLLVSEVAACPFCVTPEFGVTYDPPPFRRGLSYAHQGMRSAKLNATVNSAMSSSNSLEASGPGRRRATSLSANAPQVITTDKVRPDWSQKLNDARAHALRRSAAATALHNAAYVLGNQGDLSGRGPLVFGRRRRTIFVEPHSGNGSGSGTPPAADDGSSDILPGRTSSRRTRVDDLEELMMMEAIRLSLVAEEERKRKEEKDAKKEDKKRVKGIKKEAKQAEKVAKKNSSAVALYPSGTNESTSTWSSAGMLRSTSNLGQSLALDESARGKGKGKLQESEGSNAVLGSGTISDVNQGSSTPSPPGTSPVENPQQHLQDSRSNMPSSLPSAGAAMGLRGTRARQLSNASSIASSYLDSTGTSFRMESNIPSHSDSGLDLAGGAQHSGTPPTSGGVHGAEPMFNFRSLAAMVGDEEKANESEHVEFAPGSVSRVEEDLKEPSPSSSPIVSSFKKGSLLARDDDKSQAD